jgi:DNA-binding response OmpR family regulator
MINEAMLLEQNKRLRERNEELEEEVRLLREREAAASVLPAGLPHLTKLQEKALTALWCRRGVVDKVTIYGAMYGDESEVGLKIVDVIVHQLRQKLTEPHHPKILTSWGRGFEIDRAARNRAASAAGEAAQLISEAMAA